MSGLFPLRGTVDLDDREPRLVGLDEEVADEVFEALSSTTTRRIFDSLHAEPHTASELAEATDTSVQNVQYHLEKLQSADLVEVVDTWYSERGTEMKVYAPTNESLVLFAGGEERGRLRDLLQRALAIVAVLAPIAAGIGWLAGRLLDPATAPAPTAGGDGGGGGIGIQSTDGATKAAEAAAGMDPALVAGVAFFLGGTFVLALVVLTWYWRQ
jgi:DNA-binding transcriptional ArsR family regulator